MSPTRGMAVKRGIDGRKRLIDTVTSGAVALLATAVLIMVAFPLFRLLQRAYAESVGGAWAELFREPWFPKAVGNTLTVVGTSALIALGIAAALAWINEGTDARIGTFGEALPLVPLFLPAVAMAIGWVLLGNATAGFLNGAIRALLSPLGLSFQFDIYSYPGLILVYVLNLVPYAYLPIVAALRSLDPALEEAARVSGASPGRVFLTVSVPAILPALLGGFVLVLVVGFALYSVPVIIATRADIEIFSVRIIQAVRNTYPPAYEQAVLLSSMMFAVLLALWFIQRRVIGAGHFARVGGRSTGSSITNLGPWRLIARTGLILYLVFAAVLPLLALLIVSFQTFWVPDVFASQWTLDHFNRVLFGYPLGMASVRNSLTIGLVGGAVTVIVAAILIIYVQRRRTVLSQIADGVSKLPAAIPNTILAIAFIFGFAGPPLRLGGTMAILFIAYFIVYLPYASIASEASAAQIDISLEEASLLSGATESRTFRKVVVPLMAPGLLAAWALVFVRVVGDLAVAVLLGTGRNPLIGFVLLDVWDQGVFNRVAALAVVMTLITMPIVLIMMRLGKPKWRRLAQQRRPASSSAMSEVPERQVAA